MSAALALTEVPPMRSVGPEAPPLAPTASETRLHQVKALWIRGKADREELGRLLYEEREERLAVGGRGVREGFHQWLREAGIPKASAYRRIADYAESVGLREPKPVNPSQPETTLEAPPWRSLSRKKKSRLLATAPLIGKLIDAHDNDSDLSSIIEELRQIANDSIEPVYGLEYAPPAPALTPLEREMIAFLNAVLEADFSDEWKNKAHTLRSAIQARTIDQFAQTLQKQACNSDSSPRVRALISQVLQRFSTIRSWAVNRRIPFLKLIVTPQEGE